MNRVVNESGVFQLKDLVPYGDRKVIYKNLIENNRARFAVISLAAGSGCRNIRRRRMPCSFPWMGKRYSPMKGRTMYSRQEIISP